MNVGFDAKRAFHNNTGLGNYSRTLIKGLSTYYPENDYFLFNPKPSNNYKLPFSNVHEILPESFVNKNFSSLWRSSWVKKDLKKLNIDVYHGLSHEIPVGIQKTDISSVVTIHDLIFERYPRQFKKVDVAIYRKKFRYSCRNANRIIAISNQTKQDLIDFYEIDEAKIDVCYQSCDPAFAQRIGAEAKESIRKKYDLPHQFFLYVGSIIERKNLLNICKALLQLRKKINIPLVVIGNGKKYKQLVKDFIAVHQLQSQVIFLSDKVAINNNGLNQANIIASIYQMAIALVYPSFFEGFGIPVLEALWSSIPVITSNTSCLPEAGGRGALYVDPFSVDGIAQAMQNLVYDDNLRVQLTEKGWEHAQNFTVQKCTSSVMDVYKKTI